MNVKIWKVKPGIKKNGVLLAAGAGMLSSQPLLAGSVFINQSPAVATAPLVVQEDATNDAMNVFIPAGVVNPDAAGLFQYGPVNLHPHVNYSFQDATGVESSPGNSQYTTLQALSPGLTADLGRHWTADYTPTLNFYSGGNFHQSVDHSASLNGATHYEDWTLSLSQSFSSLSDPDTETAAQTSQQTYLSSLSAAYAFNDKWVANFGLAQNINLVSGLQNSYDWSTSEGANYQFSPRLYAGFSVGDGYTLVSPNGNSNNTNNPDVVNESFQFTAGWRATEKISLQGSVGLNDQQFLAAGYNDSLSPIFGASIQYQPFQVTQIALSANRSTGTSDYYIEAQSTDVTSLSLSVSQRILVHYTLILGASYARTEYTTTLATSAGSLGNARTDNQYSFNASFGRSFLKRGNWAVTYAYNDNQSSTQGYAQRSNQIGFQVGFSY
jgi:hypothetical protein